MFHKVLETGRTVAFEPPEKGELSIVVVIPAELVQERMVAELAQLLRAIQGG